MRMCTHCVLSVLSLSAFDLLIELRLELILVSSNFMSFTVREFAPSQREFMIMEIEKPDHTWDTTEICNAKYT